MAVKVETAKYTVQGDFQDLISQKSKNAFDKFKSLARGAFKGLAAAAAAGTAAIAVAFRELLKTGDQIQKLSLRLGASTEALSEYRHMAELSGVPFTNLTTGIQRMTRRVAEAATGQGVAKDVLAELNLEAAKLVKMKPEDQFEAIAEEISKLTNQSDRVRIAFKLFDTEGVGLLQTMGDGRVGIQKMREEARNLGLTITGETANSIADFNDTITRLKGVFAGVFQIVATDLLPTFKQWAQLLLENKDEIREGLVASVNILLATLKALGVVIGGLAVFFNDYLVFFRDAGQATSELIASTKKLVADLGRLGSEAVQKFVDGFQERWNALKERIGNLIPDWLKKFLQQSSPAELGALDSFSWGANAVELFAQGMENSVPNVTRQADRVGLSMNRTIGGAILSLRDGFKGLEDFAVSSLNNINNNLLNQLTGFAVNGLISGVGNLFNPLPPTAPGVTQTPGFFGPGFATGGAFTVPGSGGTDSSLVRFRATPGERVTVNRPGQDTAPQVNFIVNNFTDAKVEQKQVPNGNGGFDFIAIIKKAVSSDIREDGPISREFRNTFNVQRNIAGR